MKDTSKIAGSSMKEIKPSHYRIILKTMERINKPATPEQISVQCNLSFSQVWRRMSELERLNKVECTDIKALNSSGRPARKWQIKSNEPTLF